MQLFKIKNLDHIVLRVNDLEKSLDFYVNIIGCTIAKKNEKYGMIHLQAGSSMIDIIDLKGLLGVQGGNGPQVEGRNVDHFCLRIEPFDENAILHYFTKHGMNVDKAEIRYGAEGDGASIYIHDPDGNRVELKGPSQS